MLKGKEKQKVEIRVEKVHIQASFRIFFASFSEKSIFSHSRPTTINRDAFNRTAFSPIYSWIYLLDKGNTSPHLNNNYTNKVEEGAGGEEGATEQQTI